MYKAFETHKTNGMKLNFKNGNSMSVIWGPGSYTDNYGIRHAGGNDDFLASDTAEISVGCSEKMFSRIRKKLSCNFHMGDYILGNVNMKNFLIVANMLEKEIKL